MIIPFLSNGTQATYDIGFIDNIQKISVKEISPASCGYDALMCVSNLQPSKQSYDEACSILERNDGFSATDIVRLADTLNQNVLVMDNVKTIVHRCGNAGDSFGLIVHASKFGESAEHWYPCTAQIKRRIELYPVSTRNISYSERV